MTRIDVPVLIVGAGPTGLTAAILLARHGIPYRIVERRSGPQRAPAAHAVNARTFEILRQAGVDMDAVLAAAKSPQDAGFVYWVTKLGGEVIGRLPYERQGDDVLALTPTPLRNLSQHRLEPILVDALDRDASARPFYGHAWESAEQDGDLVRSRVRDIASGEIYEVSSRYLLAADGASSPVRRWLGIEPVGPDRLQSFVMMHFAADLRDLVRDSPGVLYWICDPECGGTMVAHDIDREWVYMHAFDPERESRDDYTTERCAALVRRAIARDVALEMRTISTWTMTAQVVERYRDGRAFLIGDSAHRFPPTGGLGLNTGVQDAHNLVWKIAAVERGWADRSLLDTYESERRPVAQNNADQSLRNAFRLLEVPQALGFDDDPEASRARLATVLGDATERARVVAAIENQGEHFDMLGLQLGYAYETGALVPDGSEAPANDDPVRRLVPSSRPGARLPHGWLERDGRRVSSLDLIDDGGLTLLVGPRGDRWIEAARGLGGVPIRAIGIGAEVADPDGWWAAIVEIGPDGALLVRPDQHVAYRSAGGAADPSRELEAAVRAVSSMRS